MEAFLSNLGPHVSSLLNMMVMKRVNTGDRMLDNVIQMIATTLLTALVTAAIHLSTKGRWKIAKAQVLAFVSRKAYDPLTFDPAAAPEKPANGTTFLYRRKLPYTDVAVAWFYLHHSDKFFVRKSGNTLIMPGQNMMNNVLDEEQVDHTATQCFGDELLDAIPVWKHTDGYYVYFKSNGSNVNMYSDSCEALKACYYHYLDLQKKREEFSKEKRKSSDGLCRQGIYKFQNDDVHHVGWIHQKKMFNSLFFHDKENVINALTAFRDKTLYPKHLPVDNKMGILLHGPPGTGKTGFISALSNFLQRSVLMVHMSRITTRKAFDELLEASRSSCHIYVFEEFDCMPGVQRRDHSDIVSLPQDETATNGNLAMAMMMSQAAGKKDDTMMEEYRREREKTLDKLDLGYILTKLDGLECAEDRIMVATTNYPERIDPALLRPGRFGLQLHLTRCTKQMLVDMICFVYELEDSKRAKLAERVKDIPDMKWSPAEVLQLTTTKKCHEELIEVLRMASPSTF